MTYDAFTMALTAVSGAGLILICMGRKRLAQITRTLGRGIWYRLATSPAHDPLNIACGCDSCTGIGDHHATLPVDRYALDEMRARLDAKRDELALGEAELAEANQRLLDAMAEACEPGCMCLDHTWQAIREAHGTGHPDHGFEMEYADADAFDAIVFDFESSD